MILSSRTTHPANAEAPQTDFEPVTDMMASDMESHDGET